MLEQYEKIAFVWDETGPKLSVPNRLNFRRVDSIEFETFVSLVATVMDHSLDRSDIRDVSKHGAPLAASIFLAAAEQDFEVRPEWWQIAFDEEGLLVGFILPAAFQGAEKGGLREGTFYYLGVSPEHRGNHYVYDLLCHGTSVLQTVGVWRIYSDTDALNAPMIQAFHEAGYKQFGSPKSVPL